MWTVAMGVMRLERFARHIFVHPTHIIAIAVGASIRKRSVTVSEIAPMEAMKKYLFVPLSFAKDLIAQTALAGIQFSIN